MTREEMLEKAKETRSQVTGAQVAQEEMDAFPAEVTKLEIPVRTGQAQAFLTVAAGVGEKAEKSPLVINLHGGGFIRARTENDELFCRRLSAGTGLPVLDVDYSIAPDFPFPTALYESYDVYLAVRARAEEFRADPERIILAGHSAGGNLVAGVNLLAGRDGMPRPFINILDYPPLDLLTDPEKKRMGPGSIPPERSRLYNLYYCAAEQQGDPLVSPVCAADAELAGFAPTLVISAGDDSLCDEAEQFALRLGQAGVEVTLRRFPGQRHGFTIYRNGMWKEAADLIERYIKAALATM